MDIWNIQSNEWTKLVLWQVDEETYKVVIPGDYKPLLTNPFYVLIDQKYASIFNTLNGQQVRCHPVRIIDLALKTEFQNYVRLDIQNTIDPTSIQTQNSEGKRVWHYNENVFVSSALKRELIDVSPDDFSFSTGFSLFAG